MKKSIVIAMACVCALVCVLSSCKKEDYNEIRQAGVLYLVNTSSVEKIQLVTLYDRDTLSLPQVESIYDGSGWIFLARICGHWEDKSETFIRFDTENADVSSVDFPKILLDGVEYELSHDARWYLTDVQNYSEHNKYADVYYLEINDELLQRLLAY